MASQTPQTQNPSGPPVIDWRDFDASFTKEQRVFQTKIEDWLKVAFSAIVVVATLIAGITAGAATSGLQNSSWKQLCVGTALGASPDASCFLVRAFSTSLSWAFFLSLNSIILGTLCLVVPGSNYTIHQTTKGYKSICEVPSLLILVGSFHLAYWSLLGSIVALAYNFKFAMEINFAYSAPAGVNYTIFLACFFAAVEVAYWVAWFGSCLFCTVHS